MLRCPAQLYVSLIVRQAGMSNCFETRETSRNRGCLCPVKPQNLHVSDSRLDGSPFPSPLPLPFLPVLPWPLSRERGFHRFLFMPPKFRLSMARLAEHKALTGEFHRQFTIDVSFLFSVAVAHGHYFCCSRSGPLFHTKIILNFTLHLRK